VEAWQLAGDEAGLAAFVAHRDFRDYYNRRGGSATVGYDLSPDVGASLTLASERWSSRRTLDPFTLLRNTSPWRPNPRADEGRVAVVGASAHLDTRNDVARPWAGWYVGLDYELGSGRLDRVAPLSAPSAADARAGRRSYGRGLLDLRRYNRLTPDAQLNLRVVAGGWLHGDPLPAQRRLSVSGPGALAGFDFRAPAGPGGADVAQCGGGALAPAGTPAECERVALFQAEYRSDVRLSLFGGGAEGEPRFRRGRRTEFTWVLFADAGRGWLVGPRAGTLAYPAGSVPGFGTFLTDVGAGIDFGHPHGRRDVGPFGVYVAKSVSRPDQAANLILRLQRRF
jgi:outer membrane protein assembly factor BamA